MPERPAKPWPDESPRNPEGRAMPDDHIRPDDPAPRRDREDDAFQDAPRGRRRDEEDDYDRPRRRRDEDDEDDRLRRRFRRDEEEGDATGGLIPYKNGLALGSYYTGVFSLIPCVGLVLGPIAIVLGFLGLNYANKHPRARGKAHAIVGIVLGVLVLLGHVGLFGLMLLSGIK
jgi:hypothetical protein